LASLAKPAASILSASSRPLPAAFSMVLARLAGDEALGGTEYHHRLDRVERQLGGLLGAARLPVVLAVDGLLHQLVGRILEFLRRHHAVHRADLEGSLGLLRLTRGDPLDGIVRADQARQAHRAAKARVDPQLDLGQPHLGLGAHHPVVGGQAHLEPAAQRNAVDGGHRRERQILHRVEDLVGVQRPLGDFFFGELEVLAELGDVGADDESILGAGDDQPLDAGVLADRLGGLTQLRDRAQVKLVDGVFFAVKAQLGDAAAMLAHADGLPLIHG
jgi:hypothetical protein